GRPRAPGPHRSGAGRAASRGVVGGSGPRRPSDLDPDGGHEPMITPRARLAIVVGLALGLGLACVPAADAQEWKIYLKGKVEPIVATFYSEEAPWVFYQDDESMYLFALGCNRIDRVERGGAPIPMPACPVEALPTTTP